MIPISSKNHRNESGLSNKRNQVYTQKIIERKRKNALNAFKNKTST